MNGGDFRVSPELLQQVSADLRTQATDLLSQLDQFNKDVEARSATWEGAARSPTPRSMVSGPLVCTRCSRLLMPSQVWLISLLATTS